MTNGGKITGEKGTRLIDTQMHTSAAHAGASERKSTVIAQIRHVSGDGGVPKSKIERKVRSEYGRGTKGRARRCTRGEKDERRRTNRGIDFNGKRSREVFEGARQVRIRAELKAEKNEQRIHYCMQVRKAGAQWKRRAGGWAAIGGTHVDRNKKIGNTFAEYRGEG